MLEDSLLVIFLKDVRDDYLEVLEEQSSKGEVECSWSPDKLRLVRIQLESLIAEMQERK